MFFFFSCVRNFLLPPEEKFSQNISETAKYRFTTSEVTGLRVYMAESGNKTSSVANKRQYHVASKEKHTHTLKIRVHFPRICIICKNQIGYIFRGQVFRASEALLNSKLAWEVKEQSRKFAGDITSCSLPPENEGGFDSRPPSLPLSPPPP